MPLVFFPPLRQYQLRGNDRNTQRPHNIHRTLHHLLPLEFLHRRFLLRRRPRDLDPNRDRHVPDLRLSDVLSALAGTFHQYRRRLEADQDIIVQPTTATRTPKRRETRADGSGSNEQMERARGCGRDLRQGFRSGKHEHGHPTETSQLPSNAG